jgi:hypothetical protein
MKRSATFTSFDGARTSQGIVTTERAGHLGHVVYVSRGVTFTPDDLESGTLGVLVDRYGDPREGAPEMLAAAQAAGWQATLITLTLIRVARHSSGGGRSLASGEAANVPFGREPIVDRTTRRRP